MVKKLIRYDFQFFLRRCLPLWCIVLGTALLNRVIQFFEAEKTSYNIIFGSSIALLVIASLVCVIGTVFIAVNRYYTNMFTNEGYLTLSLPVTPHEHIVSKVLTATIFAVFSFIAVCLGISIAMLGDVLVEVLKAFFYEFRIIAKAFGLNLWFYLLELLVLVLALVVKTFLLYDGCISIGQRAKKSRVASAVGCFFIYYFALQVLGTVILVIFAIIGDLDWFIELLEYIEKHARFFTHLFLILGTLWNVIFGGIYYAICHHTLAKKLNLE